MSHPQPSYWVAPLFALSATVFLIMLLRRASWLPLDHPNDRSLHVDAVPRIGGLAIVPSVTLALIGIGWDPLIILCAVALSAVSYLDDRAGLPTIVRFGAHIAAAAVFLLSLREVPSAWLSVILVLAIVWMTNLYNFMDGSDGLAGGMAVVGFASFATAAWMQGDGVLATASAVIAAAAAGFLVFNFHPARIFLGDAGSIPMGFLAAAIGVTGWRDGVWPIWFPVMVFSAFTVDATVTLLRRLLRGERVWRAHRTHYYQRLVQLGWGHRRTALAEYAVMIVAASAALAAFRADSAWQGATIGIFALLLIVIGFRIDRAWSRLVVHRRPKESPTNS